MLRKSVGRSWKVAAAFVAATAFMAPLGHVAAQTGAAGANAVQQPSLEPIKVRNMRSGLMAWMLDPAHNPEPIEVLTARQTDGKALRPTDVFDLPADFKLPAGIVSVTSIDAQNTLAVAGTPEGVKQMRTLVEERDRAIPQIEIEAKFVSVDPAEFEQLGIAGFMNGQPPAEGELQTAELPVDFHQRFDSLVAQGKAQITNRPRVTTMYRLAAGLGSRQLVPAQLTVDKRNSVLTDLQQQLDALPLESQAWVGVHAFLRAKPIAIDRDSVKLELATVQNLQVAEPPKLRHTPPRTRLESQPVVTLKSTEQSAVLEFKDGESVLVRGLYPTWMMESMPKKGNFAVVTVKTLRRSES